MQSSVLRRFQGPQTKFNREGKPPDQCFSETVFFNRFDCNYCSQSKTAIPSHSIHFQPSMKSQKQLQAGKTSAENR